jgi:serine/threonine-protein kinase
VHRTLARAYINLGRHREARPHADAAVDHLTAAHGRDDARVAAALLDRAPLRMGAGDTAGAQADAADALRIRRALLPPGDPMIAAAHGALGFIRLRAGDTRGAERSLGEARRLYAAAGDRDHAGLAELLAWMAELERSRGRPGLAVRHRREALEATRRRSGAGSRAEAAALVRLAEALAAADELDEAERLVAESTRIVARTAGPTHPTITYQMLTRADLLARRGRVEEAEAELRGARRIAESSLDADHYIPMFLAMRHGQALASLGRHAEALAAFEHSYAACVTLLGTDHPSTHKVAAAAVETARAAGDPAAVEVWQARTDP